MLMKIQPDATVCKYLFTAKSFYMFRVSQHPSSGVLKTVTAASGTGHNSGTATSLQRGLIGTGLCDSQKPVPIRPRWREEASACHTDDTPTSHTETPTHIETRTHNQCGDTIEKSKAPDDGCTNVRNMMSIEEVK